MAPFFYSIVIGLICYAFYKWATLKNDYFLTKGVKYLKPTFLIGFGGKFFLRKITIEKFLIEKYNEFPNEKLFGAFDFRNPMYFIRDPNVVKQLTIKDFDHFEDHRAVIDEKQNDILGNSLIMLRGEKWHDMRATLSPAFTGSKMRQMFELVRECAADMSEYFKQKTIRSGEIIQPEMKELFCRYTNDVIASTAFGIKVNSFENENNEFFLNGEKMLNFRTPKVVGKLILSRLFPKLSKILNLQLIENGVRTFFTSMVLETIETRNREKIYRPDLINLLMKIKKNTNIQEENDAKTSNDDGDIEGFATAEESNIGRKNNNNQINREWNDNEIVAQCFLFFFAGFETTSTVLSFATYLLALNPDCQEKLYEEILITYQKLNNQLLTYDELQKMKYLDQVVSEALRMWPPLMFTDRVCVKDYQYNDEKYKFIIEKGTSIWIPIYAFHHDPQFFPNPYKFDPDRFNDINKHSIQPGTYIPFGVGPRNCIGSRFALMEVKAIIYYLMLNFKFELNDKTQVPIRLKSLPGTVVTENGIHLNMTLRN